MTTLFSTKGLKPGHWLTCWHCNGTFRFKEMRYSPNLRSHQTCPFCDAEGIGMDIFRTNKPRKQGKSTKPALNP
jgi:DnaJ-class molecular chaperone